VQEFGVGGASSEGMDRRRERVGKAAGGRGTEMELMYVKGYSGIEEEEGGDGRVKDTVMKEQ